MEELLVLEVIVERKDRDTVVDVETEAQAAVVDDDHVLELTVSYYAEILDRAVLCLYALLSEQSCLEYFFVWIKKVQNGVCVASLTG
jgi:hypothetical protein